MIYLTMCGSRVALRVIERQLCDHSVISDRKLGLRTLHLNLVIKHLYRDPMPLMHKNNENNNKITKKISHLRVSCVEASYP